VFKNNGRHIDSVFGSSGRGGAVVPYSTGVTTEHKKEHKRHIVFQYLWSYMGKRRVLPYIKAQERIIVTLEEHLEAQLTITDKQGSRFYLGTYL
jgi:hypothetical protein